MARDASQADIKAAYRRLAKQYHPDMNPDDPIVEQKFKELGAAYDILADPDRRARFDRGEIDADGNRRATARTSAGARGGNGSGHTGRREHYTNRHSARTRSNRRARSAYERRQREGQQRKSDTDGPDVFGGGTADDLFNDIFGDQHHRQQHYQRGGDVTYTLRVDFSEAIKGARKRVPLANGRHLDVDIPAGSEDGQTLRLKGQGMQGLGGAPDGDAYVDLKVDPHPYFERHDIDIYVDIPITLHEALSGGKIDVPTVDGLVKLAVPAGTSSGQILRLKGKGVIDRRSGVRGDQYIRTRIVLPENPDHELTQAIRRWAERHPDDPRKRYGLT